MKIFLILIAIISMIPFLLKPVEEIQDFDGCIHQVARKAVKNIEKEFPFMTLVGIGGAINLEGIIEQEELVFEIRKNIDRDQSIQLFAKIIDEYMKQIYSEKKLQSYLEKHPFTYKNLEIAFFVRGENGEKIYHPNLWLVELDKGIVTYKTERPSEKYYYENVLEFEEPYEEAAKRVGVWYPEESEK